MSSDEIPTAVNGINYEEDEDKIPDMYKEPQRWTEYQINQHLITKHLLDDDEEEGDFHSYEYCHFLAASYHSPTPSDWTYKIYLQYLMNSSALDHVRVLFKEPEEIELDGLEELFEDSICNKVAIVGVDRDDSDMAVSADEHLCNGDMAESKEDIVIIPATCTTVNLLGKKLGADVKENEVSMNNYSGTVASHRIYNETINIYGQKYWRFWFDRGK